MTPQEKFRAKCEKIAEKHGMDVSFEGDKRREAHEDDGTLHVCRNGLRAMFDVSFGQTREGKEQNEKTRAIMEALKIKVTDRVLTDEDEDEECCSECGRPL